MTTHTALAAANLSADARTVDLSDPPFMPPTNHLDNSATICDVAGKRSTMSDDQPTPASSPDDIEKVVPEEFTPITITPEMVQSGVEALMQFRLGDDLVCLAYQVFMDMAFLSPQLFPTEHAAATTSDGSPDYTTDDLTTQRIDKHRGLLDKLS